MVIFGMNGANNALMLSIFATATIRLIPAIRNIMTSWSALRINRHTIATLRSANIDECSMTLWEESERLEMRECIELRNVSFKFDSSDKATLESLSLKIFRGESVGIQGASGVGKTTLFNIILGLYQPTSGSVYIDGTELNSGNIRKWQNSIGYVSQSLFISDGTLIENIAFGSNPADIDLEALNRAIDLADLRSFVDSLPEGLMTRIGEQGARISAGQRQRIAIARALYRGCNTLLFDEATSSLDRESESSINEAIRELKRANSNLTIVVIAHRESSLEFCDRIITLE
jgi:ABC-type bacteriocin/lantibiotic exporter with double-glycine peptidase domain